MKCSGEASTSLTHSFAATIEMEFELNLILHQEIKPVLLGRHSEEYN